MNSSRILAGFAVSALVLAGACANPEADWEEAQRQGTEEALLEFIQAHPDTEFAEVARRRIVEMAIEDDWERAEASGTMQAYEEFLDKHPDSDFADRARSRLETLRVREDWDAVQESEDVDALRAFADRYPGTLEAELARTRIAELREPEPEPAPEPEPEPEPAPAPTGTHEVQLAALGSESAANSERDRLARLLGDVLGDVGFSVQAPAAGQNLWRVTTAPMDRGEATALCNRVKEAGADCFVRRR